MLESDMALWRPRLANEAGDRGKWRTLVDRSPGQLSPVTCWFAYVAGSTTSAASNA